MNLKFHNWLEQHPPQTGMAKGRQRPMVSGRNNRTLPADEPLLGHSTATRLPTNANNNIRKKDNETTEIPVSSTGIYGREQESLLRSWLNRKPILDKKSSQLGEEIIPAHARMNLGLRITLLHTSLPESSRISLPSSRKQDKTPNKSSRIRGDELATTNFLMIEGKDQISPLLAVYVFIIGGYI